MGRWKVLDWRGERRLRSWGMWGFRHRSPVWGTHLLDGRAEGKVGWWKEEGVVVEVDGESDVVIHQVGVVVEEDGEGGGVVP